MKSEMTYNDAYLVFALINDLYQFKLPTKATTEKLLLRAHYIKPIKEFEEISQTIHADETSDEDAKKKALECKAAEIVEGFTPRYLSETAFEEIVEAASMGSTVLSNLAQPLTDKDGKVTGQGSMPAEVWLQYIVDRLIEV